MATTRVATGGKGSNPKTTLYVGGLHETVNEEILQGAFLPFGDLKDVNIPIDHATGQHRGFGFVEFEEKEDAAAAIDNMHNAEIYGRVLKVRVAGHETGNTACSKPPSCTWLALNQLSTCTAVLVAMLLLLGCRCDGGTSSNSSSSKPHFCSAAALTVHCEVACNSGFYKVSRPKHCVTWQGMSSPSR